MTVLHCTGQTPAPGTSNSSQVVHCSSSWTENPANPTTSDYVCDGTLTENGYYLPDVYRAVCDQPFTVWEQGAQEPVQSTAPLTNMYCDGTLTTAADGSPLCSGDWVHTAVVTVEQLFQYPVAADSATAWMAGFGLPMTIYLVSWGYGQVVNFFSPKHETE